MNSVEIDSLTEETIKIMEGCVKHVNAEAVYQARTRALGAELLHAAVQGGRRQLAATCPTAAAVHFWQCWAFAQ